MKAFVPVFFSCSHINDQHNLFQKHSHEPVRTIRTATVIKVVQDDSRINLKVLTLIFSQILSLLVGPVWPMATSSSSPPIP